MVRLGCRAIPIITQETEKPAICNRCVGKRIENCRQNGYFVKTASLKQIRTEQVNLKTRILSKQHLPNKHVEIGLEWHGYFLIKKKIINI